MVTTDVLQVERYNIMQLKLQIADVILQGLFITDMFITIMYC